MKPSGFGKSHPNPKEKCSFCAVLKQIRGFGCHTVDVLFVAMADTRPSCPVCPIVDVHGITIFSYITLYIRYMDVTWTLPTVTFVKPDQPGLPGLPGRPGKPREAPGSPVKPGEAQRSWASAAPCLAGLETTPLWPLALRAPL